MLAARGARETDSGTEQVGDTELAAALRQRAKRVYLKTWIAVAVTGAILLVLRKTWDL